MKTIFIPVINGGVLPETVKNLMKKSDDEIWQAIGRALIPKGQLSTLWKDQESRSQWINEVKQNNSSCGEAKGLSKNEIQCADVYKKAESIVKTIEKIQANKNTENQLRDLTNMIKSSGNRPYLMRTFLELSVGDASCTRLTIDNSGNDYAGDEYCRKVGDTFPIGAQPPSVRSEASNQVTQER